MEMSDTVSNFLNNAGSKEPGKANQKSAGSGRSKQMSKKKGKAKPPAQAKAAAKKKASKPAQAFFTTTATTAGAATKKKAKAKKRRSLYVGRGNNSNINLKRLGGVGNALGLKDIEKYVKPVMLIATGAVGAAFMDGKFIKGFVENTLNVSEKWSPSVRMCIALAIGFTVARFSKSEEAKLVAVGLSGQQVLEFVRTLAAKMDISFEAKEKPKSSAGVKTVAGLSRAFSLGGVKNASPFRGAARLNLGANRPKPAPISGARIAPAQNAFASEFPV